MLNRKWILLLFLIGFKIGFCQSSNVIIQINNELLKENIINARLDLIKENQSKISKSIKYIPGELIFDQKINNIINSDSLISVVFSFQYQTFDKDKSDIKKFEIPLSQMDLKRAYLIINIYDFRNKKYKRWYQPYTNKDYLIEKEFPGSGIYPKYVN